MHCSNVQWPSLFFSASSISVLIPQQCKDINLLFAPIFLIEELSSFDAQFLDAFSSEVFFLDTVNGFIFCFFIPVNNSASLYCTVEAAHT